MSAVATREREHGALDRGSGEPPHGRLFEPEGPTLEDTIVAAWEELATAGRVACPVCSGDMSRVGGCEVCGAELA